MPTQPMNSLELILPVEGMTCASCVNRVERYLRRADGVLDARVNLATEQAHVSIDPTLVGRAELERAVEASGYRVRPQSEAEGSSSALDGEAADLAARQTPETRRLGIEALIALAIGLLMLALMLWPGPVLPMQQLNLLLILPATFV